MIGRFADEVRAVKASLLQLLVLAPELGGFEGAHGHDDEPVRLEGLFDVIVSAALDGDHRRFDVAVTADDHNRKLRMLLLDARQNFQPVELRALQPYIEDNERRPPLLDEAQRLVAILGEPRLVSFIFQDPRDEFPNIGFVVDDQNVRRHELSPSFARVAAWPIRGASHLAIRLCLVFVCPFGTH